MISGLSQYLDEAYLAIEGWVETEALWVLEQVSDFQKESQIDGGFCEIGVHHGRFFIAMEHLCSPGQRGLAMDIFDMQDLNIDRSGSGSLDQFRMNIEKYAKDASRIFTAKCDSTTAEARKIIEDFGCLFRLFSVDGGHTFQHIVADLGVAEARLANGGAVFVDDYCNPGFPGVTEGLIVYLRNGGSLTPVCAAGGKMLLTTISYAERMRQFLAKRLESRPVRTRLTGLCGYPYLVYRKL